jgi:NAD(P)-dependent dehydrogenase (short-subunit alcohol dehydrogenase family)
MQRLKDRVANFTDGVRGISRNIPLGYANEGAYVVFGDIDPDTAMKTSEDIIYLGHKSICCETNVVISLGIQTLTKKTITEFGRVHILVNNAIKIAPRKFKELSEEAI